MDAKVETRQALVKAGRNLIDRSEKQIKFAGVRV